MFLTLWRSVVLVCAAHAEPLDNLDAVMAAVDIMTHPLGLHMSRQKVTVSTVGLVDKLEVFAAHPNAPHLALSLHATTDEVRRAGGVGGKWKGIGRGLFVLSCRTGHQLTPGALVLRQPNSADLIVRSVYNSVECMITLHVTCGCSHCGTAHHLTLITSLTLVLL